MATRINIEEFGKGKSAELRNVAKQAITRREAIRGLGIQIAKSVGFDARDNTVVLVAEKNFDKIH